MYKYTLIRSKRKTIGIEIGKDGEIKVRAPLRTSNEYIERVLREKEDWILRTLEKMKERAREIAEEEKNVKKLTSHDIQMLKKKARREIEPKVAFWADRIGVSYSNITIRGQKTRWGSCTSKGNLNFNYMLALCPEKVMDYVVIHELCHRMHMNHSKRFWHLVAMHCPEYKASQEWLRRNGRSLIDKLP